MTAPRASSPEPSPAAIAELVAALESFVQSAPWALLDIDDWIHVDGDGVPEGLGWALVGDDERMPYLTLVRSVEAFMEADAEVQDAEMEDREPAALHAGWAISAAPTDDDEADDGPHLVPLSTVPEATEPIGDADVRHMARVIGALATVEDDELDAGRFARRVEDDDGAVELRFALPAVVTARELADEDLLDDDPEGESPFERFAGMPSRGRRVVAERLVETGLAPIDGHLLFATLAEDEGAALACYERARDAGEAILARDGDDASPHAVSELVRTLGAIAVLAHQAGDLDALRAAWARSLELDEEDSNATGLELLLALLEAGHDDEADALFDDERLLLEDDESVWLQAIVAHRRHGATPEARSLRTAAAEACPDIPLLADALLDEDETRIGEALDAMDPDDPTTELFLRLEPILSSSPDLAEWIAEAADAPKHTPKKRKHKSR